MARRRSCEESVVGLKELLDDLTIDSITVTEEELGRGAFGVIRKVSYNGASCAGKQLHSIFFEGLRKDAREKLVAKFAQECRFHSQQRHPNIVQLFGVHFCRAQELPVLVMELMETSLHSCLEEYPNIPSGVKNQILLDVALGLLHLHMQLAIHRDLTASNILLTSAMRAKISDLGMAKVLDVGTQDQVLTTTPGNMVAMPPEACTIKPAYSFKLDIFSYGALIVHILTQEHPVPSHALYKPDPSQPTGQRTLTAIERREQYIKKLDKGSRLYSLAITCLSDDQDQRPSTSMLVREVKDVAQSNPPPASTSLLGIRMHKFMRKYEERLSTLEGDLAKKQKEMKKFKEIAVNQSLELKTKETKLDALERANRALQKLISSKLNSLPDKTDGEESESSPQVPARSNKRSSIPATMQKSGRTNPTQNGVGRLSSTLPAKSQFHEQILVSSLPSTPLIEDDRRNVTLVESQGGRLTVSHNLDEIRSHSPLTSVHITRQANLPMPLCNAQAVNLRGRIFVGGQKRDNPFEIYSYLPKENEWEYFMPAPTTRYAMACFCNQLVCVGGLDAMTRRYTSDVHTLNDCVSPYKWCISMPAMKHARADASAIGFSGSLVVAGGQNELGTLDSIEVYSSDSNQWAAIEDPHSWIGRIGLRTAFSENCWYLTGGERGGQLSSRAEYVFISSLIGGAFKSKPSTSLLEESTKHLPTLPLSGASVLTLEDLVFVVGGEDQYSIDEKGKPSQEVEIYMLSQHSWTCVGKIPESLVQCLVIPLSSTEALVCGGMSKYIRPSTSVYKITLK